MEVWVGSQGSPFWTYGEHEGTGTGLFPQVLHFSAATIIPSIVHTCIQPPNINTLKQVWALENLNGSEDINGAWENITENIKTSAKDSLGLCEWRQHKQWFAEECSWFFDKRKQAKIQWLQDPNQSNVDNLNKVRREDRHFRNKEKEYLKVKNDDLETIR